MRNARFRAMLIAALALTLAPRAGFSADALRSIVREGNLAFLNKDYDQALQKYHSAQARAPESPYLYFNIGAALQQQGKHDEAMAAFQQVRAHERPALAAGALYNIGVSQYRQAEQAISAEDYQKALQLLEAAMQSNKDAVRIDPADEDARFNYEQSKRKLKEVLDLLKKKQEEQQKQQPEQNKDQQQQNQDQQKQEEQKQGQEKKEQQKQEQDKQDQNKDGQQDKEKQAEQQKKEQEAQQQKKQEQEQQEQKETGEQDQKEGEQKQPQPVKAGEMTPEEARRLLNSLPEQDAREVQKFLQRRGGAPYRVEKNW